MTKEREMTAARVGVMQGRLSPPVGDSIQAFPGGCWRDEFALSEKLGLSCMEWIFEAGTLNANPLMSEEGIREIRELSKKHGVAVNSVVADYFMEKLLFGEDTNAVSSAVAVLLDLIERCKRCGIGLIELPFVDASALKTETAKQQVLKNLQAPLERARELGVSIGFETSLPPGEFRRFLDSFKPFEVAANFDMGNSASLGFSPAEEIPLLGRFITNVHIKDRVLGGGTVPLGRGDTDFKTVFKSLRDIGYGGDLIFQSARQDPPDHSPRKPPLETIGEYMDFVRPLMESQS